MRAHVAMLGLAAALALAPACKRQRAPKVAEIWDEDPAPGRAEALGNLAPPWPAATRGRIENGLVTFWLRETDTPALHVRLMVPTSTRDDAPSAEASAVVGEYIRYELARRLGRAGITVQLERPPGRMELALHGREENLRVVLRSLAVVMGNESPENGLLGARERVADEVKEPRGEEIAAGELVARLMQRPGNTQRVDAGTLSTLPRAALVRAWDRLADPRDAVLVVHAGSAAQDARTQLRRLAQGWHGTGQRKNVSSSALGRLRGKQARKRKGARLLASPPAPFLVAPLPSKGGPVLMLGRLIPTNTLKERSLARLAHRIMQEEIDARLSISGDTALFVVRVPLSSRDPERSAQEAVEILSGLAQTRHQSQRLFQAAQLWLGARVVQASIDGEDWTALWSESIDLADVDENIGTALSRDAKAMLEPQPEALQAWQKKWLDPRAGEPGWQWVVAGADRKITRRLARVAPIQLL